MSTIMRDVDLKNIANRLLTFRVEDIDNHVQIQPAESLMICHMVVETLKSSEVCISLKPPLNIVGDLHGQFHDLLRIFDALGQPPESRFLFLGDYVDRGKYSLEVITLLFVLMLLYPTSVYLLRGNHETANICCRYGFRDEIIQRYRIKTPSTRVLGGFVRAFQWLPICAIIDGQIFCCHGGISPNFMLPPFDLKAGQQVNIQTLNSEFKKPLEPIKSSLMCDLMWSDPQAIGALAQFSPGLETATEVKWLPNKRGCSFAFSATALEDVMRILQTQMLVRGHQVVPNGYQSHLNKRCITVFSAPGYCGVYNNLCGVLQIEKLDENKSPGSFYLLKPIPRDGAAINKLFWVELKDI